jgi:bifunctional non-homologous end joining protein LigD
MATRSPLKAYKAKRNFAITPEPAEGGQPGGSARSFVVQKHWASRLHYDFRLELDGRMKSWAVPKGPSYDPHDKRMAVHVEDHPISYNQFEGEIPAKQYGAGKVIIWDKGLWTPIGDARKGYRAGNLKFEMHGHKLHGKWALVRMKGNGEKQEPWLLIKEKDEFARPAAELSIVDEYPDSVAGLPPVEAAGSAPKKARASKIAQKKETTGLPLDVKRAALPATLQPQLATLVDGPPADSDDWLFEIKFDGYRLLARVEGKEVRLLTRNGNDWTHRMPALTIALAHAGWPDGWYDGEIVVPGANGIPSFQELQNAFESSKTKNIIYFLFDVPFFDGYDLRAVPLIERRKLLEALFQKSAPGDSIRLSEAFPAAARDIVSSACQMGLEGVIGKRKTSTYSARRSPEWIKLKCSHRQEFVIGGYTDPKGSRTGLGSLLLGVHDQDGKLQYAGNVGTGFNDRNLADIKRKLDRLHADKSPFAKPTVNDRRAHWVKPTLLAEVSFGEWTQGGHIRHSVFLGLRADKKAVAIVRERPSHPPQGRVSAEPRPASAQRKPKTDKPDTGEPDTGKLKVTNPERIIDESTHATKLDLVRYYGLVAPLMFEHLSGRPVLLVRAPAGIKGQLFYQKHLDSSKLTGVKQLPQSIDRDHPPYLEIASALGIASAAQMNVIEFHTWNAVKTAIGKPDRMTFDLDPGQGVEWPMMQEAALLIRSFLGELELSAFVKTSGGKGLHVVVPIQRRYDWDTVKDYSQAIVQHLAKTLPTWFSATSGPRNRIGKIFIDYLRNGFGATTATAWSARARPGLGISVPIAWDELDKVKGGDHWKVATAHTRLDKGNAPWHDYEDSAQSLTPGMRILGFAAKKRRQ